VAEVAGTVAEIADPEVADPNVENGMT